MDVKVYSLAADGDKYLAPHFQVKEFRCRDGSDVVLIHEQLPWDLESIRYQASQEHGKGKEIPLIINSGYRTVAYNSTLKNASKHSQHLYGYAASLRSLDHFRSKRHDLHELLGTQFARDRSEDTGADRLLLIVKQNGRILVEANAGAVRTADGGGGANYDCVIDFALLDTAAGGSVLNRHFDNVTNGGIATL